MLPLDTTEDRTPFNRSHLSTGSTADRGAIPLGSLTQRRAGDRAVCPDCGRGQVTQIDLTLTDGTPVDFIACHVCPHKSWNSHGVELNVADVLKRSRKTS